MKNLMKKIESYFSNRKTRPIAVLVALLPALIVIAIFGVRTIKGVKELKSLNSETVVEVKDDHKIPTMNYVLRENETEYQKELFIALKSAVETGEGTNEDLAKLVAENFVADFFTFANKIAQYDVGGMYYVNKDSRENMYVYSRDTIYKFLNDYIDAYGKENLMVVKDIVASSRKAGTYPVTTSVSYYVDEYNLEYEYTTIDYDCYEVELSWDYDAGEGVSTTKWPKEALIKVIDNSTEMRYEIVYVDTDYKNDVDDNVTNNNDVVENNAEVKSNG